MVSCGGRAESIHLQMGEKGAPLENNGNICSGYETSQLKWLLAETLLLGREDRYMYNSTTASCGKWCVHTLVVGFTSLFTCYHYLYLDAKTLTLDESHHRCPSSSFLSETWARSGWVSSPPQTIRVRQALGMFGVISHNCAICRRLFLVFGKDGFSPSSSVKRFITESVILISNQ